jgi:ABC-type sugar transport system permease subunit
MLVATRRGGVRLGPRPVTEMGRVPLFLAVSAAILLLASFVVFPAGVASLTLSNRLVAVLVGGLGTAAALEAYLLSERPLARRTLSLGLGIATSLLISYISMAREGARAAVISVLVAVSLSAALFVGANRLLDQATKRWVAFTGLAGAIVGALVGLILVGNRAIGLFVGPAGARTDRSSWLIVSLALGGLGLGIIGGAITGRLRLPLLVLAGAGSGALVGVFLRVASLPAIEPLPLVLSTLAGAALLGARARWRGRPPAPKLIAGAALGWLVGAFGLPELGGGTVVEGLVGTVGAGALVGLRLGIVEIPELSQRIALETRLRVVIFLAPALTFVGSMLVIPTIRTMYLALLDRRSQEFVGLENFRFIFSQPSFLDASAWRSVSDSVEFLLFTVALVLGLAVVTLRRRRTDGYLPPRLIIALITAVSLMLAAVAGRAALIDLTLVPVILLLTVLMLVVVISIVLYTRRHSGNSGFDGPGGGFLGVAVLLLSFAFFTNLRGTLMNNLWWVVVVTVTATGLGLAIAALADRSAGESIAKSLIFMPMALSFVGASIIWRFMYISRLPGRPQTGVLNAIWVGIGLRSVSERSGTIALALFVIAVLLVAFGLGAIRAGAVASGGTSLLLAAFFTWFGMRFNSAQGVAGVSVVDGQAVVSPIIFLDSQQFGAYNNIFVMVPFIWIYTGFAMVIFSAAIKGIPADLLEAGRVDGATDAQSFWRIVLPQIQPTIGVVLTTIIVVVMKVFDIVKVMTNGQFGTQVLANEMWNRSFLDGNFGVGSAVAVVLFLSVLPVMFINIRRMQKEAA